MVFSKDKASLQELIVENW